MPLGPTDGFSLDKIESVTGLFSGSIVYCGLTIICISMILIIFKLISRYIKTKSLQNVRRDQEPPIFIHQPPIIDERLPGGCGGSNNGENNNDDTESSDDEVVIQRRPRRSSQEVHPVNPESIGARVSRRHSGGDTIGKRVSSRYSKTTRAY